MVLPVSELCGSCITTLKRIIATLSEPDHQDGWVGGIQVNDELERFSLWIGNIGALHRPDSTLSLETRLHDDSDVLNHILELLDDLNEVTGELLQIVSGEREGMVAATSNDDYGLGRDDVEQNDEDELNEETELLKEIGACISRLFRASSLIRQAAPTDHFAKAVSRNRYRFNEQFDIAHVGEKFPKLATKDFTWLQRRLGRAITQRRHYLSYIQDHRGKLDCSHHQEEPDRPPASEPQGSRKTPLQSDKPLESSSRPSTFFSKASSLDPGRIAPQMLTVEQELDSEDDARSYTTISRSVDGDLGSSTITRIPKLEELKIRNQKEFECPFCFRMKKFRNERVWRRHVFADLRSYMCTFPECDALYFGNINEWFQHEMQNHRVSYTCRLCKGKAFYLKERYLAHIRQRHPDILEDGGEQPLLGISRKPLDQISAQDCPCCSDWVNRLKQRAAVLDTSAHASDAILPVSPTDFKRHLASHLEQLALFAIPIGSSAEDEVESSAAVEADGQTLSGKSDLSALPFISSRPSSPQGPPPPYNWVQMSGPQQGHGTPMDGINKQFHNLQIDTGVRGQQKDEFDSDNPFDRNSRVQDGGPTYECWILHRAKAAQDEKLSWAHIIKSQRHLPQEELAKLAKKQKAKAISQEYRSMGRSKREKIDQLVEDRKYEDNDPGFEWACVYIDTVHKDVRQSFWKPEYVTTSITLVLEKRIKPAPPPSPPHVQYDGRMRSFTEDIKLKSPSWYYDNDSQDSFAPGMPPQGGVRPNSQFSGLPPPSHGADQVQGFPGEKLPRPPGLPQGGGLPPPMPPPSGRRQQQPTGREIMKRGVLEQRRRILGDENPDTILAMRNLASTLRAGGQLDEAEKWYILALEGCVNALGADFAEHTSTLGPLNDLGRLYADRGKSTEAGKMYERALQVYKNELGEEHPDTLSCMARLASTYVKQHRWKEAEELGVLVMETRKKVLGEEDPDTLISMTNLAASYAKQHRWEEAEELEVQVMEAQRKVLGEDNPDTLNSMGNLAWTYKNQHRWEEVEEQGVRLETSKMVLGEEHPYTLNSMGSLAVTWKSLGRDDMALDLIKECVQIQTRVLGSVHPDTLSSFQLLAQWEAEKVTF